MASGCTTRLELCVDRANLLSGRLGTAKVGSAANKRDGSIRARQTPSSERSSPAKKTNDPRHRLRAGCRADPADSSSLPWIQQLPNSCQTVVDRLQPERRIGPNLSSFGWAGPHVGPFDGNLPIFGKCRPNSAHSFQRSVFVDRMLAKLDQLGSNLATCWSMFAQTDQLSKCSVYLFSLPLPASPGTPTSYVVVLRRCHQLVSRLMFADRRVRGAGQCSVSSCGVGSGSMDAAAIVGRLEACGVAPVEAGDGSEKQLLKGHRTVARHASRKVTPGDLGDLRGCSKVAHKVSNSCRTIAQGVENRPHFDPTWPIWATFRPT